MIHTNFFNFVNSNKLIKYSLNNDDASTAVRSYNNQSCWVEFPSCDGSQASALTGLASPCLTALVAFCEFERTSSLAKTVQLYNLPQRPDMVLS